MRLLAAILFVATASALVHIQSPEPLPSHWSAVDTPKATHVTAVIALKQRNVKALEELAIAVSTPNSGVYGQHLTAEEVSDLTAPSEASRNAVEEWLVEGKAEYVWRTAYTVAATLTLEEASRLFSTEFAEIVHERTGQRTVHAGALRVPQKVAAEIAAVYGVHDLPLPPPLPTRRSPTPYAVTPEVLAKQYKIDKTGSRGTKNRQAVAEFQGQYTNETDLAAFFAQFVPNAQPGDEKIYAYQGQQGNGVEADLDIQYIMGVAPGIKTEFWISPGFQFCDDLLNWTTTIVNTDDHPNVFSVSYGWQGEMSRLGCTPEGIQAVDTELTKLAAMGVTIIVSSGDSGSGQTQVGRDTILYSSWPADSPWVTAVGATCFKFNRPGTEKATTQFGSGGGFSRNFTQPKWQNDAVSAYYKTATNLPPDSMYGKGGRGTPDVAALGEGFQVITMGRTISVGGTSASAPTFAAMVSLLNDDRIANGKAPLGYLNLRIYSPDGTQGFVDVTAGDNRIGRGGQKFEYGFSCTEGWDPVTGWGTPDFQKFHASFSNP